MTTTLKRLSEKTDHWLDKVRERLRGNHRESVAVTRRDAEHEPLADRRCATPPVDIYEDAGQLTIVADVPGARRNTIDVTWDGDHELAFYARATTSAPLPGTDWYRSFTLPSIYDGSAARASATKGVLTIEVPRQSALQPKRIAVHAGAS